MDTLADFELAWTNFDKPSKCITERRNPDGKREHPTQKPLSVIKFCLEFSGKDNITTILDPFGGSGTTARVAKDHGIKCTMIEKNKDYCRIAATKVAQDCLFSMATMECVKT